MSPAAAASKTGVAYCATPPRRGYGFLEQAEGEDAEADGHVLRARGERAGLHELRQHVAVMDDGAGDQLREEGDEERVVGEAVLARLALVRVDQVGDSAGR